MTEEELIEIEARAAAATPGPWKNAGGYCDVCTSDQEKEANRQANAEFVVHARADVPALLAEVRRQRGRAVTEEELEAILYRLGEDCVSLDAENDLERLEAEVRRLRAENEQLRERLGAEGKYR